MYESQPQPQPQPKQEESFLQWFDRVTTPPKPSAKTPLLLIGILLFVFSAIGTIIILISHPTACYYQTNTGGIYGSIDPNVLECTSPFLHYNNGTSKFFLCYSNDNGILQIPFCTNTIVPDPLDQNFSGFATSNQPFGHMAP